jgi:uncharacterized Zn finger protein (UPF0148 family)
MPDDKCPKCGADLVRSINRWSCYECDYDSPTDGDRIRELEAENARLRTEIETAIALLSEPCTNRLSHAAKARQILEAAKKAKGKTKGNS